MKKESVHKKKIVQDVVPPRSIRNIQLPSHGGHIRDIERVNKPIRIPKLPPKRLSYIPPLPPPVFVPPVKEKEIPLKKETSSYTYQYGETKKPSKKIFYISVAVFVFAISFGFSAFFKSAEIRLAPKEETKILDETFTAKKDDAGEGLSYQIVTVSKSLEKNVLASGQKKVDLRAQGKVILYNNYSATAQKLVANTRLQTPEGLVFRLISATVVPGKTIISGKTVPGSVLVLVVADGPGATYNIGLKDFTFPGFKGDTRYSAMYGRSKTTMSGGFSGIQKVVAVPVLNSTDAELEKQLKLALAKDIVSQIPANFIMYSDDVSYDFDPIAEISSENDTNDITSATLSKKGTVNAIIFDRTFLSRAIVEKVLATSTSDMIKITNLDSLGFSYPQGPSVDPIIASSLIFSLKGNAHFVWVFDENKLKSELLGTSKTKAHNIIAKYNAIKESWVLTRPFWNTVIPNNPDKVKLINTLVK